MSRSLKINFISHLDPFHYSGGGEQVTRNLIEEGRRQGHKIRVCFIKPSKYSYFSLLKRYRNPDISILFDVFNVPGHKKHFSNQQLVDMTNNNYVIGQNAYGDICNLNALPCNGEIGDGDECVVSKEQYFAHEVNESSWNNGRCTVNQNRALFENAKLNMFVSPLHASIFHKLYPSIKDKSFIIEPIIDVDSFVDKNIERDIPYASYGGMSEAKGFYNIWEQLADKEVVFFGSGDKQLAHKNKFGKEIGRIPYDEMPDFLNRVEHYVHLPRWPEPNGLVVNQAALCGCKLVINDNVGAITHNFDILDRDHYSNHVAPFWDALLKVV
ncbi:MAG: hypothetical protein HQL71_09305 [Magnetococcales bacterium]|nr:hypothetical protein [Magnetococcales bacterium]